MDLKILLLLYLVACTQARFLLDFEDADEYLRDYVRVKRGYGAPATSCGRRSGGYGHHSGYGGSSVEEQESFQQEEQPTYGYNRRTGGYGSASIGSTASLIDQDASVRKGVKTTVQTTGYVRRAGGYGESYGSTTGSEESQEIGSSSGSYGGYGQRTGLNANRYQGQQSSIDKTLGVNDNVQNVRKVTLGNKEIIIKDVVEDTLPVQVQDVDTSQQVEQNQQHVDISIVDQGQAVQQQEALGGFSKPTGEVLIISATDEEKPEEQKDITEDKFVVTAIDGEEAQKEVLSGSYGHSADEHQKQVFENYHEGINETGQQEQLEEVKEEMKSLEKQIGHGGYITRTVVPVQHEETKHDEGVQQQEEVKHDEHLDQLQEVKQVEKTIETQTGHGGYNTKIVVPVQHEETKQSEGIQQQEEVKHDEHLNQLEEIKPVEKILETQSGHGGYNTRIVVPVQHEEIVHNEGIQQQEEVQHDEHLEQLEEVKHVEKTLETQTGHGGYNTRIVVPVQHEETVHNEGIQQQEEVKPDEHLDQLEEVKQVVKQVETQTGHGGYNTRIVVPVQHDETKLEEEIRQEEQGEYKTKNIVPEQQEEIKLTDDLEQHKEKITKGLEQQKEIKHEEKLQNGNSEYDLKTQSHLVSQVETQKEEQGTYSHNVETDQDQEFKQQEQVQYQDQVKQKAHGNYGGEHVELGNEDATNSHIIEGHVKTGSYGHNEEIKEEKHVGGYGKPSGTYKHLPGSIGEDAIIKNYSNSSEHLESKDDGHYEGVDTDNLQFTAKEKDGTVKKVSQTVTHTQYHSSNQGGHKISSAEADDLFKKFFDDHVSADHEDLFKNHGIRGHTKYSDTYSKRTESEDTGGSGKFSSHSHTATAENIDKAFSELHDTNEYHEGNLDKVVITSSKDASLHKKSEKASSSTHTEVSSSKHYTSGSSLKDLHASVIGELEEVPAKIITSEVKTGYGGISRGRSTYGRKTI